jgi:hypothetical protein
MDCSAGISGIDWPYATREGITTAHIAPHKLSAGRAAEENKKPEEARAFYTAAARQTDFGKTSQRTDVAHAVKLAGSAVMARNN